MTLRYAVLAALLALGCGESLATPSGVDEPLHVENGQFFNGPLPTGTKGPKVTNVQSKNNLLPQGVAGKNLEGDAEKTAWSVALRFDDIGSGYWVVPIGPYDPYTESDLSWTALYDVSRTAPVGEHKLVLSASDHDGNWGPVRETTMLVKSLIPEGHVVVSLVWDTDVDLDLHIVAPTGKELDPKHPNTLAVDGGLVDGGVPGAGQLDRDSNANCVIDGYRQEDVVWHDQPVPGRYIARADMFSACGQAYADFTFTIRIDGKLIFTRSGRLMALEASGGGKGAGLFITDFTF